MPFVKNNPGFLVFMWFTPTHFTAHLPFSSIFLNMIFRRFIISVLRVVVYLFLSFFVCFLMNPYFEQVYIYVRIEKFKFIFKNFKLFL